MILLLIRSQAEAQERSPGTLALKGRLSEARGVHKPGRVAWSGLLLLEFENKGRGPLILINPKLSFGTGLAKMEFLFSGRTTGKSINDALIFRKAFEPSSAERETLASLLGLLKAEHPDDNLTVIVAPGSSFQLEQPFEIVQTYSHVNAEGFATERTLKWEGDSDWFVDSEILPQQVGLAIGEAVSLRVTYEYAVSKYAESPDLLDILNQRWKKYGEFPLDRSGNYRFVSEMIPMKRSFEKVDWPTDTRRGLIFTYYSF